MSEPGGARESKKLWNKRAFSLTLNVPARTRGWVASSTSPALLQDAPMNGSLPPRTRRWGGIRGSLSTWGKCPFPGNPSAWPQSKQRVHSEATLTSHGGSLASQRARPVLFKRDRGWLRRHSCFRLLGSLSQGEEEEAEDRLRVTTYQASPGPGRSRSPGGARTPSPLCNQAV